MKSGFRFCSIICLIFKQILRRQNLHRRRHRLLHYYQFRSRFHPLLDEQYHLALPIDHPNIESLIGYLRDSLILVDQKNKLFKSRTVSADPVPNVGSWRILATSNLYMERRPSSLFSAMYVILAELHREHGRS